MLKSVETLVREKPHCIDGAAHNFVHYAVGRESCVHGGGMQYFRTDYFHCTKCCERGTTFESAVSYDGPPVFWSAGQH